MQPRKFDRAVEKWCAGSTCPGKYFECQLGLHGNGCLGLDVESLVRPYAAGYVPLERQAYARETVDIAYGVPDFSQCLYECPLSSYYYRASNSLSVPCLESMAARVLSFSRCNGDLTQNRIEAEAVGFGMANNPIPRRD